MHELSIAMSMIDMANEEVLRRGGGRVAVLHLKLGPLSGVVKEALEFSYQIACLGTSLEGSQLIIEDVPVRIHCAKCRQDETVERTRQSGEAHEDALAANASPVRCLCPGPFRMGFAGE